MEIIDCQIHEPQAGGTMRPTIPYDESITQEIKDLINVELAREAIDSVGIRKAVVFARQEFNEAAVARYPQLFGAVNVFDPFAQDLEEQLADFKRKPGMLGVRNLVTNFVQIWQDPTAELKLNPAFEQGGFENYWALAEKYDLPMFFSAHDLAGRLDVVAERHPNLTIIVDHFGITQSMAKPIEGDRWKALPGLLNLAKYPNVYVKCCGTPVISREDYPYNDIWPYFHQVLKAFGPERCMWGSDYTRMRWGVSTPPDETGFSPRKDWKSYANSLHYLLYTDEISQSDKQWLFNGTVRRALKWND